MLWKMSYEQLVLSFMFIGCATFIGGYVIDKILGYAGFTVLGNWILLLVGTYIGLYTYNRYGYTFGADTIKTVIVASTSAFGMFITVLGFKLTTRS